MNVLLFKLGAIGDVIMSTPFIRQLKIGLPEGSKVDFMIGYRSLDVLVGNPYINNIIGFDEGIFSNRDIIGFIKLLFKLRKLSKKYDAIIVMDKHIILNLTSLLAGFNKRIGFDRIGKDGKFLTDKVYRDAKKREVDYYLSFLPFLGINPDYEDQRYNVFGGIFHKLPALSKLTDIENKLIDKYILHRSEIDNLVADLKKSGRKIVGISTGGGNKLSPKGDCRWWNLDNWEKLSNCLIEQGYEVVLLGKGDRELNIDNDNFHNFLGKYTFHETLYFITKLDFVICQESGFAHFTGCTNTPMIALCGPTNPYRFYPHIDSNTPHPLGWIWKMEKECYDIYGGYGNCNGDEIDKITVIDVLEKITQMNEFNKENYLKNN